MQTSLWEFSLKKYSQRNKTPCSQEHTIDQVVYEALGIEQWVKWTCRLMKMAWQKPAKIWMCNIRAGLALSSFWAWWFFMVEPVLCIVGCLQTSLALTHLMPVGSPNLWQPEVSPDVVKCLPVTGRVQSCSPVRTIVLGEYIRSYETFIQLKKKNCNWEAYMAAFGKVMLSLKSRK